MTNNKNAHLHKKMEHHSDIDGAHLYRFCVALVDKESVGMKALEERLNNEIDLIELFQKLWNGKWLIAATSAAALALGGAHVALTPNSFDASITVRPLDAATIDGYRTLNHTIIETRGTFGASMNFFSAPGALAEFTEVLLQRDTIVQAAVRSDILAGNLGSDTTPESVLRSYAFDVKIVPVEIPVPSSSGSTNTVTAWQIRWRGVDTAKSNEFITETLGITNETTRQRLIERLSRETERIRHEQSQRIQQIETEISNAIENYRIQINDELAYLSEQASLARVLEIGTVANNSNLEPNSIVEGLSPMSYTFGYRALEQQITILSSREQIEPFVDGLRDLQAQLRTLEQDRSADRLLEAIETTPLSDTERFRAVQYDLASIKTTYHKNTRLILALWLVLGGLLGTLTVLIRNTMKTRQAPHRIKQGVQADGAGG